ncbi:1601_t:CDS:2 [Ambispora gerdemannii]|uniref:1601_t:CDS:1 n=1 Tax=Ambispora gerdemannii TaxID=144530 RepID=A0A9N9FI20_9GLOM|nr:1601_t:CDS:2 [Ambispora gerdemannii]
MVFINGVKYAWYAFLKFLIYWKARIWVRLPASFLCPQQNTTCIKGHRSTACHHSDRPLSIIKRKGRPITQCAHCRELRKTQKVHVKCTCNEKKKEEVEALLNPCQCTTGAKCICCRPAEQEINDINNISVGNTILDNNINQTSTTSDFSFPPINQSTTQIYDQIDRFFAPTSNQTNPITSTATTGIAGSLVGNSIPLLQMTAQLNSSYNTTIANNNRSTIGPLAGEIIGQNAVTAAQLPVFPSLRTITSQQSNSRFYSPKVTNNNNINNNSWNSGGYLSDGSGTSLSPLSESTMSYQSRNPYKHRRIASYPGLSYPLPKLETQNTVGSGVDIDLSSSIISAGPQNYNSYHEEDEKSMIDESGILGEQLCHSTSNDLVDIIYGPFQSCKSALPNGSCCGPASASSSSSDNSSLSTTTAASVSTTSSSVCRCGTSCSCQGCQTHLRRENATVGDIGVHTTSNSLRNININNDGGSSGVGNCCSSNPQPPEHTTIVDEDGVLLCGCGCRKPDTDCSDCVKNLCEGIY